MAKEQWHSWSRTIITIISLAFVCGITYNSIGGNTDDINKVDDRVTKSTEAHEQDIKQVEGRMLAAEEDIHRIELNAKDIQNMAAQSVEAFTDIKKTLTEMQKTQSGMATVQAVNSAKLETLTKDE